MYFTQLFAYEIAELGEEEYLSDTLAVLKGFNTYGVYPVMPEKAAMLKSFENTGKRIGAVMAGTELPEMTAYGKMPTVREEMAFAAKWYAENGAQLQAALDEAGRKYEHMLAPEKFRIEMNPKDIEIFQGKFPTLGRNSFK